MSKNELIEKVLKEFTVNGEVHKTYVHTLGVIEMALTLNRKLKLNLDENKIFVSAALHDIAKLLPKEEMEEILKNEFSDLVNKMEELNDILANPKLLKKVLINECKQVKKDYGTSRLTKIEEKIEEIVIDKLAMINSEQVMLTASKDGYVKKVSLRSYNSSKEDPTGLKDGDELIGVKEVNTLDTFLFVSSKGTYGYAPVYEIDEAKWKDVGAHFNSAVTMTSEEKIINAYTFKDFNTGASIITLTKKGMIKRTLIEDLEVQRHNKSMSIMNIKDDDIVVDSLIVNDDDVLVVGLELRL